MNLMKKILIYGMGKTEQNLLRILNDKTYLKLKYRLHMGKKLNLKNPQTFNEKLQWLKLYNRKPEYTMMADKVEVRKYIAEKLGEEYLIPCLGVWDNADDIDFDKLPEQFVLKCNHNSGKGMCICKDKSKLNIKKVRKELNKGLKEKYFYHGREWPYKNIKPKIIAEKYMVDESGVELKDYKLMCFNGKVKCIFTCSERYDKELKVTFFDKEWNRLPFERHYRASEKEIFKPTTLNKMICFAEKLAENITFVRIDFYDINGNLFFGEITFFPGTGLEEFEPEIWDEKIGEWIKLEGISG